MAPTKARGTAIAAGGADTLPMIDRSSVEFDTVAEDVIVAFWSLVEVLFVGAGILYAESADAVALPVAARIPSSERLRNIEQARGIDIRLKVKLGDVMTLPESSVI